MTGGVARSIVVVTGASGTGKTTTAAPVLRPTGEYTVIVGCATLATYTHGFPPTSRGLPPDSTTVPDDSGSFGGCEPGAP